MSGTLLTYGAFSDFLEKALLAHVFGATAYTRPAALWVALYTTAPTDTTPGSEPAQAGAYARQPVTFAAAPDQPDGSSAVWNAGVLQWATATADWGTITHCGVLDGLTGGNFLAGGALVTGKPVQIGDAVRFNANQLMLGLH